MLPLSAQEAALVKLSCHRHRHRHRHHPPSTSSETLKQFILEGA